MTTLIKEDRVSYRPGSPGVPANPGSPARPGYWSTYQENVCSMVLAPPPLPSFGVGPGGDSYAASGSYQQTSPIAYYSCRLVTKQAWVPPTPAIPPTPGVPASPSQLDVDFNLGWNSGARSIEFFTGSGYAEFKVPTTVTGVVVGLNDIDYDAGYLEIDFGLYFSHGAVRVLENGVQKAVLGAHTAEHVFRIERLLGVVRYYRDGTLLYTSDKVNNSPLFLDASMYSAGDTIVDASIVALSIDSYLDEPLRYLAVRGGEGAMDNSTSDRMRLMPLELEARSVPRTTLTLPALVGLGSDRAYGDARLSLRALEISAENNVLRPSYALGNGTLAQLSGIGVGMTGGIGQVDAALPALTILASDHPYGEGRMSFAPLRLYGHAYEGAQNAAIGEFFYGSSWLQTRGSIVVVMNEMGGFDAVLGVQAYVTGEMAETMKLEPALTAQAEFFAEIITRLQVESGIPVFAQPGEVWTVNLDSDASAMYENYAFNSFAMLGQHAYGAMADGIYLLEGDDDAGEATRSSIGFGKRDFGTQHKKAVPNCYIGASSTGNLYLKVTTNDQEYIYEARRSDTGLRTQRVDLGRGLKANYFTFELFNKDGADFEFASIEFHAVTLSRRI